MSQQKTVGAWACGNLILRTNHAARFVYDGKASRRSSRTHRRKLLPYEDCRRERLPLP